MRIHHLNCISSCPLGGRLMDGSTRSILQRGHLTCHCLLVEADDRLVLVDTGFGTHDVADPAARLSRFFLALVKPEFREEMTAVRQIARLGFDPYHVRDIVLTHLDFDHAGGLDDFPGARVHLLQREYKAALARSTIIDRMRYRPQQWSTRMNWYVHEPDGESWMGFERVRPIAELGDEIALVPLVGHTFGHCGVAVRERERWALLAGDAYFFHAEMDWKDPLCTPGLRFYQWMMEKDRRARLVNQERLRGLVHANGDVVDVFCAHDVVEFERHAGRSAEIPAHNFIGAEPLPAM
ncbi:MAG TPA: MBL fold metallo-hydrolase [Nannocystaceae bacterium]|nr:MBL fold metallo-hydrolase [Nannocystaceae bacterium]